MRSLLVANWKMNPVSAAGAAELARGVLDAAATHLDHVTTVLCPPFPWLLGIAELTHGTPISIGAQNCHWEESGAHTGEVSPAMLAGWCGWVIVGHSERRLQFGETDSVVAAKLRAATGAGLEVIACLGEQAQEYDAGRTEEVVTAQARALLDGLDPGRAARVVIAYEPVWAIGTGRSAEPEHAYRTLRVIRRAAAEAIGDGASREVRMLYGGSVNAANVGSFVELPNCDGCLVGGAGLDPAEFSRMIVHVAEVYGYQPAEAGG